MKKDNLIDELRFYKIKCFALEEQLKLAYDEIKDLKAIIESLRERLKYLESV